MQWGYTVSMRGESYKLTLKEWLEHYGQKAPECPEPPLAASHIWGYWNRIRARTPAGEGISPISFESIEAFARLSGEDVTREDFVMLEALDNAFVAQASEERADMQERQRQEQEAKSKK